MPSKLYVGNLPFELTEDDLHELFAAHGQVVSAKVITDRETGRARGFGFVEMETEDEAQKAIQALDGQEVQGRPIKVNVAKPREPRSGGGGRGRW
ncbi:MAG: RNA-binding protein [Candidatus Eisenbacteria bacterium]|nr:RNA-binding protein [Candidatus Eisenbacteria bacterium]